MNNIDIPIAQLSFTQKLNLMEMLWDDMVSNEKNMGSPAWHEPILNAREAALKSGKETLSSWEEAKERIRKNVA